MIANIWENPNALEEKREQPRAWYIPYSDIDSALSFTKGRSDRYAQKNHRALSCASDAAVRGIL